MSTTPDSAPAIEDLFRRWRDEADAEALAEVLARTESELFALARRQARDDSAAWDLVQESWLTVLREAPRWDANQRLMPWIVGILQIEARRARRAAARVPDPDRIDVPTVPAADVEAPAAEVRSLVTDALGRLPDLYREVLSMHLLEDLSHAEIAQRTGREPGTVRVQVFRGLAQLRKLVPASLSLGTALAILAPRSDAAHLAGVLDDAARSGIGAGVTPAASGSAAGGLSVGAGVGWLVGAAGVALVAAGAWLALREPPRDGRLASNGAQLASPANTPADRTASMDGSRPAASGAARTAVATATAVPSAPARGVRLVGQVEGLAGLQPGSPTVTLRADGVLPLAIELEAAERFDVDVSSWYAPRGAAPREFVVEFDHPSAMPVRAPVLLDAAALAAAREVAASGTGARHEIELRFVLQPPAARVHGLAAWGEGVEAHSSPRRFAALYPIAPSGAPASDPVEGVEVRSDGSFSLRAAESGRHALVVTTVGGNARPASRMLELAAGEDHDAGRIELEGGARIAGTVALDPSMSGLALEPIVRWRPVDGGSLHSAYGTAVLWTGTRFERAASETTVAPDGSFAIAGLAPGAFELESAWRAPSGTPMLAARALWTAAAPATAPCLGLVLEAPPAVTVVTVRGGGSAVPDATVEYEPAEGARAAAGPDASGRVLLVGAGTGRLRVRAPGYAAFERSLTSQPERAVDVDLVASADLGEIVLAASSVPWKEAACVLVRGSVLDAGGLAGLRRGELPQGVSIVRATAGDDGRLSEPVPAGRWWIQIRGRRDAVEGILAHARPFVAAVDVVPGGTTRVDVELELAGRIRFAPVAAREGADGVVLELVGAEGRAVPLRVTSLVLRGDARQGRVATTDRMPFGANATSDLLEPGAYVLTARIGASVRSRTIAVEAGRTTLVELDGQ
ncbi:MAG: sigma-70 family RNA polymerase sigma factor [Planctomycetota bacterium]|nr:sigma-70 family RNA polymerase sigma factor [Planctomycetota bacterium]